jgi:hypothetical protein
MSKRYMPGGNEASYGVHGMVGAAGSLVGGLSWLALRWFNWNRQGSVSEGSVYERIDPGQSQLPGYWIGLFAATAVALLALAAYKLFRGKRAHT